MIANYHTHTHRCHHAQGTEEEYIQNALTAGMKTLGFSDHSPQFYPDGYTSGIRMLPSELQDYTDTLCSLRNKYKKEIQLHIGLETEYYPALFPELMALLKDSPVEYLILGQHWCGNEIGEPYVGRPFDDSEQLGKYTYQILQALDSGMFTYVAHPDLPNFTGDLKVYEKHMRNLCRGIQQRGFPIEFNIHGLEIGKHYPSEHFWQIVAEENCAVVYGIDAHCPAELNAPATEQAAKNFVDRLGLSPHKTIALRRID